MAYFHGVVTYIRDHFHVENLCMSGISGGCSTILALAMGIDLYQILLMGLHQKQKMLAKGVYLNNFDEMIDDTVELFAGIGITDKDCARLASKNQCFIGVTQCFPIPTHRCEPVPANRRDLVALWLASMSVVPFFKTPGVYQGKYFVDGGFSAVYSVPTSQPWDEVFKVTCLPWYATIGLPAMGIADIQPSRLMLDSVFLLYPWSHQQVLIKRGYEDARRSHAHLVSRGFRPLLKAPLTPWSEWERLFASIDENDLPPLSAVSSTVTKSETERLHQELLRTYSSSDLADALRGPRLRRLRSGGAGLGVSQSDANMVDLCITGAAGGTLRRAPP